MTMKLTIFAAAVAFAPLAATAQDGPGSHFIENWDLNQDGSVSLEEAVERRDMIFVMFDQDENGKLNAEEYVLFDETRAEDMKNNGGGHGKGGRRIQEGMTLSFNDTNGDGMVSAEEFSSKSAAWFARIDRDGDQIVTAADFGPKRN